MLQYIIHLLHYFEITESHNFNALTFQEKRPTLIVDQARYFIVLTPIQLDRQFQLYGVKIQDIGRTWKLPAEFQIRDLA